MRRRKAVKAIALGAVTPGLFFPDGKKVKRSGAAGRQHPVFESAWSQWPDMPWVGPEFWGNRLQDWRIEAGRAVCVVTEGNRSLHWLTCQLSKDPVGFETSVVLEWLNTDERSAGNRAGFLLGAKGKFDDYRSAAVFGEGVDAGVDGEGRLYVGDTYSEKILASGRRIRLVLRAAVEGGSYTLRLLGESADNGNTLGGLVATGIPLDALNGNIALRSHFQPPENSSSKPSVAFERWTLAGAKVMHDMGHSFGPVCFAQYTLDRKVLKLTAQLAPVESIGGYGVALQIREGGGWRTLKESTLDPLGRTAHFRIDGWPYERTVSYRVSVALPLKSGVAEYFYEGEIAREPLEDKRVKMAVFSCNCDYGFPDSDVPRHVVKHRPDLAVFLGDQFYESTGGFRIETSPLDRACLDYLRKWYMFGWSYRELFRNIPSVCIPDDHDVYHGNVWGEGGKKAPTDGGWGYEAQDQGGYKMPPEWVNMVQRTQTSHLPDAYDPAPVAQGIGVYYTQWNYGGISMAILEDRKFKSAPKNVLPPEAKVVNGFIQNPDFDIRKHYHIDAALLGERQMKFLNEWVADWRDNTQMKVVLSQTNFCTVATLPEGSIIDEMVPRLPIPEPGAYVRGDAMTADMDSNGWPQKGRDEALKVIRKCFALHLAGDQHLASLVHYGVDEFGDAGYAFAGPALNNLWPRRWWPPLGGHEPLPGKPAYTGNFRDGFGNRMTVLAAANPRRTGVAPALVHDRATGYGVVTFDKDKRTMTVECWPRYSDPAKGPGGQYEGWPVTVHQEENYGRKEVGYLPELKIRGVKDPVVKIINEVSGETEYVLRIRGSRYKPKVFSDTPHTIVVVDTNRNRERVLKGVQLQKGQEVMSVDMDSEDRD